MDTQADDSDRNLALNAEHSFYQLYGRLPSDAARLRLWKLKELFHLDLRDPLWGVILALEHHLSLDDSHPEDKTPSNLSLSAAFKQALAEFASSKEQFHQDLEMLGDRMLSTLIQDLAANVGLGVKESTKDITQNLASLLGYLEDGTYRAVLLEPARLDVQKMAGDFNTEMISGMKKAGNEAVELVKTAVPAAKREGMIIGICSTIAIVFLAVDLTLALVNNFTWNLSANQVLSWQESLQIGFVAGLDKNTRAILERHNSHLPPDLRLRLH